MTDAANVLSILDYVTAAGEPVSGGSIEFYQAGTSTARTVYSDAALTVSLGTIVYTDSAGFPVSTQGGSTRISIYTGTGAYKVIVKNSGGTTLFTRDNIPGALDTSGFTTTSALPTVPVSAKTAAYTITTSDRGYLFNANPTGGTFVLTLPSAVTAGNNFAVGIRHNGTANQVTIATVSSQYIRGPGTPTSYFALVGRGEEVWLTSDGADWIVTSYTPALIRPGLLPPPLHITDRLTAAPSSPTAGARYIVSGTPTGTWSTLGFAQHDIAEADGNGSWIKYTPADGWVAYVADETLLTQYRTSAWTDLSNITAPLSANLEYAIFADQKADGTVGGTATTSAWTKRTLNTTIANTITGCSLASSVVTLTTGTYLVWANAYQQRTTLAGISILQGGATRHYGLPGNTTSDSVNLSIFVPIVVSGASDTIELNYYASSNSSTSDLGQPLTISGNTETYAMLTILDLASMQGPTGAQGAQGTDGLDAAYPYQWSTSTSGDPGSGKIAGNNATIASITQLAISETDSAGGSMAAVIATWDDSTSSVRATVKISKEGATQNFHSFRITGAGTDAGTYWTFPVTYIATSGTISNADNCAVLVIEKGDKGDTGATGSAGVYSFDYTFDTGTTAADPGTGKVRANHATLSSATALYISETDRLAVSQAAAIAQWDDSTTTVKGYLTLVDLTTPANKVRFSISGSNTDNGTYDTITVTYVSGVTSLTAVNVAVLFERSGDKGADGAGSGDFVGPASSTDNAVVRFDGITGKLGQNATVTISDTGTIAGVQAITLSANDAGALGASGTAFADLFLASGGVINWNAGDVTATHSANALAFAGASSGYSFDGAVLPSANDAAALGAAATSWADLFLADGGVINWANGAMTITGTAGVTDQMYFQGAANGYFFSNVVGPVTNDGAALGVATTNMWSDLFLASGAVINFNAGDVTVTHSANALAFGGASSGYTFDAATTPSTNDAAALGSATVSWSDLFLASGGVINFNNGDVTVTHSANTLAFGGASSGYTFDALATVTSNSANALAVGANGATNPVFNVSASTASVATGLSVTGAAAAGRVAVAAISSGTDEGLSVDAKGAGTIRLGATSTGAVEFSRNAVPTSSDGAALGTTSLMWSDLFLASGSVINFNNGDVTLTHSADTLTLAGATSLAMGTSIAVGLGTIELGAANDTTVSRDSAGIIAVEGVPLYSQIPQNSQSAAYTAVLGDAQKHIFHPSSDNNARTFTIPANASVAYPIGTCLTFVNMVNTVTISITSDTLTLAGTGGTGSRTLAANGIATAMKIASTQWIISGTGLS